MLYINDILDPDFDWDGIEITEEEFDELSTELVIDYLKKHNPKKLFGHWKIMISFKQLKKITFLVFIETKNTLLILQTMNIVIIMIGLLRTRKKKQK